MHDFERNRSNEQRISFAIQPDTPHISCSKAGSGNICGAISPKGKTAVNSLDTPSRISPDYTLNGILPDHAEAFKAWLMERVKLIDSGQAVHEVAAEMLLTVRIAARRI